MRVQAQRADVHVPPTHPLTAAKLHYPSSLTSSRSADQPDNLVLEVLRLLRAGP